MLIHEQELFGIRHVRVAALQTVAGAKQRQAALGEVAETEIGGVPADLAFLEPGRQFGLTRVLGAVPVGPIRQDPVVVAKQGLRASHGFVDGGAFHRDFLSQRGAFFACRRGRGNHGPWTGSHALLQCKLSFDDALCSFVMNYDSVLALKTRFVK